MVCSKGSEEFPNTPCMKRLRMISKNITGNQYDCYYEGYIRGKIYGGMKEALHSGILKAEASRKHRKRIDYFFDYNLDRMVGLYRETIRRLGFRNYGG